MPPALLGDIKIVALGHHQSPKNAVCSLLLSYGNKHRGCAIFICHLVLRDEQGPGANLEEPPWACDGCGGGLGLPGHLSCPLGGDTPVAGKWQVFPWED